MKISHKIILTFLYVLVLFNFTVGTVSAHATPVLYTPEASALLVKVPDNVSIDFSERIEPKVSSEIVYGPDGNTVNLDNGGVVPDNSRKYSVDIKDGGEGTYTVSWKVISADDGHFTEGAYEFSVGKVSLNIGNTGHPVFQIVHSSSVPEATTMVLELIGDAILLGVFLILAFVWRPLGKNYKEIVVYFSLFTKRFRWLVWIGTMLAVIGCVSYLVYKTSSLAILEESSFTATWIHFWSTNSALYTIYRMIGALLVLIIFELKKKDIFESRKISYYEWFVFIILLIIFFMRAKISHAAASLILPNFSVFMNFVHLLFKDVWIGGLLALLALFHPIVKRLKDLRINLFILNSFSKLASISLGVAGTTGVYIVWLHLKSLSNLFTTDWGQLFLIISAYALLFLVLRIFHQFYIEPRLIKSLKENNGTSFSLWHSFISKTLLLEVTTGLIILCITSLLIISTPPEYYHYSFEKHTVSQGTNIELTQDPYEDGKLLVTLTDATTGVTSTTDKLTIVLFNKQLNIGPIVVPVEKRFEGGYIFPESFMSPFGDWQVNVNAERSGLYDATAQFSIAYPKDINESLAGIDKRILGSSLDVLCLIMVIVVSIVAWFFYKVARKNNLAVLNLGNNNFDVDTKNSTFINKSGWIISTLFVIVTLYAAGGGHAYGGIFKSRFEKECENLSPMNMWHESVPERAGQATADLAVPGCTIGLGLGQYHFADEREFKYFTRPSQAVAQLETNPQILMPNIPTTLLFKIKDNAGNPITDLTLNHDRILHTVITSQDFSVFSHVHVEDSTPVTDEMLKTGEFPVQYVFPKSGSYMVSIDFVVRAQTFSDQFYVNVGDTSTMSAPTTHDFSLKKNFDGYDVKLAISPTDLKAGDPVTLYYHIEKDGKPVTDLNPYLAVPMHISIVQDNLQSFLHIHGLLPVSFLGKLLGESIHQSHLYLPSKFGPDIEALNFLFPTAGNYYIFGEFSHNGKIIVTKFLVKVH